MLCKICENGRTVSSGHLIGEKNCLIPPLIVASNIIIHAVGLHMHAIQKSEILLRGLSTVLVT
jgi:hypothetical protein